MREIEFSIEGTGAEEAAQELFDMKGVMGHWQIDVDAEDDPDNEGTLTTLATIVGITGSAYTIAEQIRKWYMDWKKGKKDKKLKKIVLVTSDGRQMLLDHVSVNSLSKMLERI